MVFSIPIPISQIFPREYGKLIGAVVLPGLLVGFMFLMPFVGRSRTGHRLNIAFYRLGDGGLWRLNAPGSG